MVNIIDTKLKIIPEKWQHENYKEQSQYKRRGRRQLVFSRAEITFAWIQKQIGDNNSKLQDCNVVYTDYVTLSLYRVFHTICAGLENVIKMCVRNCFF